MKPSPEQTSRLISYWLRHHPEEAALMVDDFGWTAIDPLLQALGTHQHTISLQQLEQLNSGFSKVRWEIDLQRNKIRATHGHSFPVVLADKAAAPPETLYHGTAVQYVPMIAAQGLLPMSRRFVHLSETAAAALTVGARHGKAVLIEVDSRRMAADGQTFYQTSGTVWLTAAVPVAYLRFKSGAG